MTKQVKKSATITIHDIKYYIEQFESGAIKIRPVSNRDALRKFSNVLGFTYEDGWGTRTLGRKLIDLINDNSRENSNSSKNLATITIRDIKYYIEQLESGTIEIRPVSTLDALRKFSNVLGFAYEDRWDTRYFGHRIINFINNDYQIGSKKPVESEEVPQSTDDDVDDYYKYRRWYELGMPFALGETLHEYEGELDNDLQERLNSEVKKAGFKDLQDALAKFSLNSIEEALGVSDKGWDWWVNLNSSMKFALLFHDYQMDCLDFDMPYLYEECLYIDEDAEEECEFINDRDLMSSWLAGWVLAGDIFKLDITATEASEFCDSSFQYEFEDLSVISSLHSLSFYDNGNLCYFPESLIKLKNLTSLSLSYTNLGEDMPEEDLELLLEFAKAHPEMDELSLRNTSLAYELDDNDEVMAELKKLMPDCKIHI
ncbi:hypothetical protein [Moraxella bovoculi]|uniref:hypothetical protein n=1 Tax=Moraxella bovoculi TaxID=386891 RepID=UPI000624AC92|nr:hypothetical protein [Moraxella bovoculi]AKG15909.2 hypothetical protein AAX08_08360 [Moraxella bovoculi]AKG17600.1 hypothetical protein AAX10_08045 [Moraxella bovoculi]